MYRDILVPMVTPIRPDGTVDEPSVERLVDSVHADVSGLIPALSSGEGWLLSTAQWRVVVAATVRSANGLPVLAGVQRSDTAAVIEGAREARHLGAAAAVVPPPGGRASQRHVYEHYRAVLEMAEIPVFVYNETSVSGTHIKIETLRDICRLPGIVGVKESCGSVEFTSSLAAEVNVPVFEGWENLLSEVKGVAGFIGPLANLEARLCADMLADPTTDRQSEINRRCEAYGLFEDDWYRRVKAELLRRGVIDHATTIEEARS